MRTLFPVALLAASALLAVIACCLLSRAAQSADAAITLRAARGRLEHLRMELSRLHAGELELLSPGHERPDSLLRGRVTRGHGACVRSLDEAWTLAPRDEGDLLRRLEATLRLRLRDGGEAAAATARPGGCGRPEAAWRTAVLAAGTRQVDATARHIAGRLDDGMAGMQRRSDEQWALGWWTLATSLALGLGAAVLAVRRFLSLVREPRTCT